MRNRQRSVVTGCTTILVRFSGSGTRTILGALVVMRGLTMAGRGLEPKARCSFHRRARACSRKEHSRMTPRH